MKTFILVLIAIFIGGCAINAPNFINGRYYMVGDSSCSRGRIIYEGRIMCMDADGNETGYRDAMTDQQLQMYSYELQQLTQPSYKTTTCIRNYNVTNCF